MTCLSVYSYYPLLTKRPSARVKKIWAGSGFDPGYARNLIQMPPTDSSDKNLVL